MKLSIKHSPVGKPANSKGADLTYGWVNVDWEPAQLVAHITAGKPFAVAQFKNGHRKTQNFLCSSIIAVDVDGNPDDLVSSPPDGKLKPRPLTTQEYYEQVLQHPIITAYAFAVIQTASSRDNAYKCRVLFELNEAVKNPSEYKAFVTLIQSKIPFADPAAKDAARAFYGGQVGRLADYLDLGAGL
jgi:hypothetical protein